MTESLEASGSGLDPFSVLDDSAVALVFSVFETSTSGFEGGFLLGAAFLPWSPEGGFWPFLLALAPALLGGIGGFPAKGFRLLFLRKTVCCLFPVVPGLVPGLLFLPADDCAGRGIRDGDVSTPCCCLLFFLAGSCDASFLPGTLVFLGTGGLLFFLTGDCGALLLPLTLFFLVRPFLLFVAGEASLFPLTLVLLEMLRRGWFTDFFLAGDGSRDAGCERGIRDFGGGFFVSPGEGTLVDLAEPGNKGCGPVRMTNDAFLCLRVGDVNLYVLGAGGGLGVGGGIGGNTAKVSGVRIPLRRSSVIRFLGLS